jgi:hypothetical protein
MYSSYPFSTSTLEGGEWSASLTGRALAPRKGPPVPIVQEARWASEPVWTQATGKILLPLPGIEPRSPGRPARCQTLYPATRLPLVKCLIQFFKCFFFRTRREPPGEPKNSVLMCYSSFQCRTCQRAVVFLFTITP